MAGYFPPERTGLKVRQGHLGHFGIGGAVDALQGRGHRLAVLPGDKRQAVAHQVNTMQVCTSVCGNTVVMASGKPFRPSTTATRMSLAPRAARSFITRSQNLAPSFCSIHIPSDRHGRFDPQLIAKYQRRFPGFDEKIVSMYARGMSTREISGHVRELYGVEVSADLISTVTDAVLEEVTAWQSRPLEAVYPVVFFDALRVKIRDDNLVRNKAIHIALGVRADGSKEVRGSANRYRSAPSCGRSRCGCCRPRHPPDGGPSRRSAPAPPAPSSGCQTARPIRTQSARPAHPAARQRSQGVSVVASVGPFTLSLPPPTEFLTVSILPNTDPA